MRCSHCNSLLAAHDLWCVNCGRQSPAVKTELSSLQSLKRTWQKFNPLKGANVPAAAFSVILGVIPIAVLIVVFRSFGLLDLINIKDIGNLLLNLIIISVGISIFIPMLLIQFKPVCENNTYKVGIQDLKSALSQYPRYLVFSLISAVYFGLIYLICFGLPNFGSDPILRLVWLVLVNYFMALILPVPVLMERKKLGFWSAFRLSYKHFHVVRWNIYLLAVVLTLLNLVAFTLLLIPLVITIPLTWYAVRDYTDKLLDFEIIRVQA